MKKEYLPSYLPAAAVTFTPKDGGEPRTIYRPYEAFPIAELEQHAAENECGALYELGQRYYFGTLGAAQDDQKAYEYLLKAAELNVQDAQALIAGFYLKESILPKDPEKCLKWLLTAAENGSWEAMEKLTMSYRSGVSGMPVDFEQAYRWAVEAERMIRVYWAFYTQEGFVDFGEKLKQLTRAHTRMTLTLSSYCADGVGTRRDLDAAMRWADTGEQFVCKVTGLVSVPMFQKQKEQLRARMQKDIERKKQAERAAKRKKKK